MSGYMLAPKLYDKHHQVSVAAAKKFIQTTAWWIHPNGPRAAPRHHERVDLATPGFPIEFGANRFFPGLAIRDFLDALSKYATSDTSTRTTEDCLHLQKTITTAVMEKTGEFYEYPTSVIGNRVFLKFGTQAICLDDAQAFFEKWIINDAAKADPAFHFFCLPKVYLRVLKRNGHDAFK